MYRADPANAGHTVFTNSMIPDSTGRVFPDIMDFTLGEVAEIKPFSPYGLATDRLKLAVYLRA